MGLQNSRSVVARVKGAPATASRWWRRLATTVLVALVVVSSAGAALAATPRVRGTWFVVLILTLVAAAIGWVAAVHDRIQPGEDHSTTDGASSD
jgi:hypothetical protein